MTRLEKIREFFAAGNWTASTIAGLALSGFWVSVALLAPIIAPSDPNAQDLRSIAEATPSADHCLGTDHLGRDLWSRLAWGSRTVLTVAPLAVLSAYILGFAIGLPAGYLGGWVDVVLSRVSDVILSFPVLVLYIILITTIGPSTVNIVIAVTVTSAPGIGRIVRGLALELRDSGYVQAARTRGENSLYIMLCEILPNLRGPLVADALLRLGYATVTIGVLGFLGLGLPPPDPDWGGMAREARLMIFIAPHTALLPCIAISSLVIGFNLIADGLRVAR